MSTPDWSDGPLPHIFPVGERDDLNKYLGDQLAALRKKPALLRKYRLLELVCQRCAEPLAEVMNTRPHPVVCFRPAEPAAQRFGPPHRRGDGWVHMPIGYPLPMPREILTTCSCRLALLTGQELYDALRAGVDKCVVSASDAQIEWTTREDASAWKFPRMR